MNKFDFYESSVQNPEIVFQIIKKHSSKSKRPKILREDFCGTALLARHWVNLNPTHKAVAVDLDPEPLAFGKSKLNNSQIIYKHQDVRVTDPKKYDVILALNFSYSEFKTRVELLKYFKQVKKSLKPGGLFLCDMFGGHQAHVEKIRKTKFGKLTYLWECQSFNPVNQQIYFAIHFKYGKKIIRNAFQYHFRHWSCIELVEALSEAGFRNPTSLWEGSTKEGKGDSKFIPSHWEEDCAHWQAYLLAKK